MSKKKVAKKTAVKKTAARHETGLQRQKRLRSQHRVGDDTGANTQKGRQARLSAGHAQATLDALHADAE